MSGPEQSPRPPAWDPGWERAWEDFAVGRPDGTLAPVRVVRIDKGGITVAGSPGHEQLVVAAKAVRRVVVGDVCGLDEAAGRIEAILGRRTVFERRAPGAERDDVAVDSKALAANMDIVLVLQSLDAGVNSARLAREMVLAWQSGARPVVVLTKADLVTPDRLARERRVADRFSPGVPVACVDSITAATAGTAEPTSGPTSGPMGTSELLPHLPPGSVAVLMGASGAGKSTLANTLAGHRVQLTAEVRDDQRGRHTTTAGQMLALDGGRWLIDTPGIRGVGLWHADEGLELAFGDLAPHAESCRFGDCTHSSEPGCGILDAVETGEIEQDRLDAWHELVREVEQVEAQTEELEREARREANQRARRRAATRRQR